VCEKSGRRCVDIHAHFVHGGLDHLMQSLVEFFLFEIMLRRGVGVRGGRQVGRE
jgi:hypothetical protein